MDIKYQNDDSRVIARTEYWKVRKQLRKVADKKWVAFKCGWVDDKSPRTFETRVETRASITDEQFNEVFIVHCGEETTSDWYWSVRDQVLSCRKPPDQEWVVYSNEENCAWWFSYESDAWQSLPFGKQSTYSIIHPGFEFDISVEYVYSTDLPCSMESTVFYGVNSSTALRRKKVTKNNI